MPDLPLFCHRNPDSKLLISNLYSLFSCFCNVSLCILKNIFSEDEFQLLLNHLMMEVGRGLKTLDATLRPQFILEAPKENINANNISFYSFDEYFHKYKKYLKIAIRRSWIGQASKHEHGRAFGLNKIPSNKPWVFESISGEPDTGWNPNIPVSERRTVYYIMFEKI